MRNCLLLCNIRQPPTFLLMCAECKFYIVLLCRHIDVWWCDDASLCSEVAWFPLPQQVTSLRCSSCRWIQLQIKVVVLSVRNQLFQHGSSSLASLLLWMPYIGYRDHPVLGPSFKARDWVQNLGQAGRGPHPALQPRRSIHALCVGWLSFHTVLVLDISGHTKTGHVLDMNAHTVPRSSIAKITSLSMLELSTAPQRSTLASLVEMLTVQLANPNSLYL